MDNPKIRTTIDATNGTWDDSVESNPTLDVRKPAIFYNGLSGSLTRLSSGADYITANSNISLTTGSNGQLTIGVISSSNYNVSSAAGNVTISSARSDYVIFLDASSAPFSVTLPNAITGGSGSFFHLKKTDNTNNAITISASNSQLIDGQPIQIITLPYTSIKLVSNNNAWWIL